MASNKQFRIEIKMNEDADLGTTIMFFQKLLQLMAKYGVTHFSETTVLSNYKELARYETNSSMTSAIKEFHEDKLREHNLKSQSIKADSEVAN